MSEREAQAVTLRQEIERLKVALQTTDDEAERYLLHARLNEYIRKSLRLIDQRIQACGAALTVEQPAAPDAALLERHVGEAASPRPPRHESEEGGS